MGEINYNSCYPGMYNGDDVCFRFNDKDANENEQAMVDNAWREQLSLYGQKITYYANGYSILSADNFYGEDSTRYFAPGVEMVIGIELNENADTFSRFGFQSDDAVTAVIHISTFQSLMSPLSSLVYQDQFDYIEPKSGDVFALTEYGKGRPGRRGAKQYEITDRIDQDISSLNQLGGHYVWRVTAKRFEYSFEPGLSAEIGNHQVYDNSYSGIVSGIGGNTLSAKQYDFDVNEVSRDVVYDMAVNSTDVYGDYSG